MRENLLKKQPTWGLRRAQGTGQKSVTPATLTKVILVLLTMFLLPSAAWGQGNDYISSTFSGINLGQGQGEGSGPISYNSATATTSTTDASTPRITQGSTATGWDVKNLSSYYSICTGANNATSSETNFVFHPIDVGQANTITFTLESQFGINGKFVKAEIIYNYSYIKSITADANKKAGSEIISLVNSNVSFTCSESGTAEEATGTITANASDYSNMVFDNNNIDLSFTVTTAAVQSGIPSFTISEIRLYFEDVTEQPFNIWVNGTSLTGQNITTFLDGKLGYTQPDGNKPAILHLKGTTAIQSIYTTLENLEIHLSGENKITPSSQVANGICSSQSRDEGALTFTAEEGGSLTIATGVSVIRGFGKCTGNLETHAPYQVTNWGTPSGSYYYLLDNHRDNDNDTTSIKWLRITETQTYPLWVTDKQATASNKGNVLGDGKVSFTPAEGTTPAKLILNNATIESKYGIDWTGDGNFTIQFSGNNIINSYFGGGVSGNVGVCINGYSSSNLTITAANDASSLTLKPDYKPESVNNKKAISGFGSVSLDEDWGMYYTDNYSAATATSLTAGEEVVICKGQPYGISVGGVLVTSKNMNNILGDKVSFTPATVVVDNPGASTPATLTLDGATISGNIESRITPLAVYLKGSSTITPSNTSDAPFQYTGTESSATLTFESSEADDGELTLGGVVSENGYGQNITLSSGNYTYSNTFGTGESVTTFGDWMIDYPESKKHIFYNPHYGITINNYEVTKKNKNDVTGLGSDFKYLPEAQALVMPTNTSLADAVVKSHRDELTIYISGDCVSGSILFAKNDNFTATSGTLTIKKDPSSTASVNKLTLDNSGAVISGFTSVSVVDPMKLLTPGKSVESITSWGNDVTKAVFTDEDIYNLWIGGERVTSGNKDDVTGEETVTFDPIDNILTLNRAEINLEAEDCGIESKLGELTVNIIGTNTITCYGENAVAIKGTGSNSILFTGEATSEIDITALNPISDIAATYENGLGLTTVSGQAHFIEHLKTPGISSSSLEDGISVTLSRPYEDGNTDLNTKYENATLFYSITYASETDNVDATEYTAPFTMTKPGTVTAYLTPGEGRGQSDNETGKYYGYPDAPYTMGVGDEITPAIYPNIVDGEYIGFYDGGYSSNNETIATFAAGKITAKEPGTTTLTATLSGSDMAFTVLNPYDPANSSHYPITFSVIVGENLDNLFAANQNFGTWYNTSDKTYKVPDGITAYIITGVDGDKVTIAETKVIPPNAPILMEKGENAKAFTYTEATDTDGSFPSGNILNYTTTDKEAVEASKLYVLYNGQFVKVTAGTKILANHCYLDLGGTSAGTRGFYNIGDGEGTTAIREVIYEGVNSEKLADGAWHDLQGRKFTTKPTKPGLYILNGKKIVIK